MTNVSPVKQDRYFDLRLVFKNDDKRAVCFTADKRNQFQNYQEQKSPLKITNFTVSKKFASEVFLLVKRHQLN